MKALSPAPSLVDQAYEAILEAICDGRLAPGARLVQEQLADRLGVSRQPIQQALLLLRNDGVVDESGRRGLHVGPLDPETMRHRYEVRAALDALAARRAAGRCAASPSVAGEVRAGGERIVAQGLAAVRDGGSVADLIARDVAFHAFLYDASGNTALGPTAQPLWRYLRRAMGEVVRTAQPPLSVWQQHREILDAVVAGEAATAEALAVRHVQVAADRLARDLTFAAAAGSGEGA